MASSIAPAHDARRGLRERVAAVKADQKQLGRYRGGRVPFGFSVGGDGSLVEVPKEQEAIVLIKRLRSEGMTLRGISYEIKVATGLIISHRGVASALRR